MKGFAIHNSMTDHGGIIPATQMKASQMGNLFLLAGDGHFCPKCKCWSTIIKSHDHVIFFGKPVAYAGDKLTFGAKVLPKQSHVVGDSGGASPYSIKYQTQQNLDIPNNMIENFSKVPKQSLTEDQKILTSEECRLITFILWGEDKISAADPTPSYRPITQMPEIPLNVRKEITRMYFSAVDADESMGIIQTIIESLTSIGPKSTYKILLQTIIKDLLEMKVKEKFNSLWNNSERQKYFKVGSNNNPVERFQEIRQIIKKQVKYNYTSYYQLEFNGYER